MLLMFQDKTVFEGIEGRGEACGPVTAYLGSSGLQQLLCDPAVSGRIVLMTFPHGGIYGAQQTLDSPVMAAGAVVEQWGAEAAADECDMSFAEYIGQCGLPYVAGADIRTIARYLREQGPQRAALADTVQRAEHLLRFDKSSPAGIVPYQPRVRTDENVALVDIGLSCADRQAMEFLPCIHRLPADVPIKELGAYDAVIIGGGAEAFLDRAGEIARVLQRRHIPLLGFGVAHAAMARESGYTITQSRLFAGPSFPVRELRSGRILQVGRSDWYEISGTGDAQPWFEQADADRRVCGLRYSDSCRSVAFHPTEDLLRAFIKEVAQHA